MENIVTTVLIGAGIYLVFGFLFGIAFLRVGISKVDEAAENTSWKFRVLLLPGMLIFWPLFLIRWMGAQK